MVNFIFFMCLYYLFFDGHMVHPYICFSWVSSLRYGWFMCLYYLFYDGYMVHPYNCFPWIASLNYGWFIYKLIF